MPSDLREAVTFNPSIAMQRSLPVLEQRRFGETMRRDPWWLQNVAVVVVFSSFLIY